MAKSRKLKGMSEEVKYELALLEDEKNSATQLMKELKKEQKHDTYRTVKSFRNRICKQIRELNSTCANSK
jgi:hypothetical protein